MFRSILKKGPSKKTHRPLRFESLEFRELLSVSVAEIPLPDFEPANSAYIDTSIASDPSGIELKDSGQQFVPLADAVVNLAPPKATRPAYTATPTTLKVYWSTPVGTSTLKTEGITNFKVTLLDSKGNEIDTQTVGDSDRECQFEGLNVKTRYQVQITSCGGTDTSSARATLKVTATTAAFPAVTAKASNLTLNSVTLTVTDKDKITPFEDGKTVKTYTIQYVEKISSTPNWNNAQSQVISAGTSDLLDIKKGTVAVQISGLTPGTQYFFQVLAAYTDGTTPIQAEGRQSTFKTAAFPATTISKTFFSVNTGGDYGLTIGLNGKTANLNKLDTSTTVSFSLLVSTATTIEKATGKLVGAQPIAIPATFSSYDDKGVFSMTPVDLNSAIVAILGANNMLASKTLSFQLEVSFSGITTTAYSKMIKTTMPAWHKV